MAQLDLEQKAFLQLIVCEYWIPEPFNGHEVIDFYTHRSKPNGKHLQEPEESIETILRVGKRNSAVSSLRVLAVDDPIEDTIFREDFSSFEFS